LTLKFDNRTAADINSRSNLAESNVDVADLT